LTKGKKGKGEEGKKGGTGKNLEKARRAVRKRQVLKGRPSMFERGKKEGGRSALNFQVLIFRGGFRISPVIFLVFFRFSLVRGGERRGFVLSLLKKPPRRSPAEGRREREGNYPGSVFRKPSNKRRPLLSGTLFENPKRERKKKEGGGEKGGSSGAIPAWSLHGVCVFRSDRRRRPGKGKREKEKRSVESSPTNLLLGKERDRKNG